MLCVHLLNYTTLKLYIFSGPAWRGKESHCCSPLKLPQELELYVSKAVSVVDGVLELRTKRENIKGNNLAFPNHTAHDAVSLRFRLLLPLLRPARLVVTLIGLRCVAA